MITVTWLSAVNSPTVIPLAVLGVFVLLASLGLVVAVARARGPGPGDTAVAYERAWDRLDFVTVWNLSSPRMRDGRSRDQFVRDKQAAYREERGLAQLIRIVSPEQVDVNGPVARVLTRLELRTGESVVDEILLERTGSSWAVTAYHIASRHPGRPADEGTGDARSG